jgi:transcriptional regulator with XRE-family HTH domain
VTTLRDQLGERIAELRRIAGMKRETFSEAIGLSARGAAKIEKGIVFPRPETLERIAKTFNVPLKELFDFGDTRSFPPPPPLRAAVARRVVRKPKKKSS